MSANTLARRERPWRGADDPGEGCLPPLTKPGFHLLTLQYQYVTHLFSLMTARY